MKVSRLIEILQQEQQKYGDIDVVIHVGKKNACKGAEPVDIATFTRVSGNQRGEQQIWISSEPAE